MESIKIAQYMDSIEFDLWRILRSRLGFAPESFFDSPDLELTFVGIRDKYYEA